MNVSMDIPRVYTGIAEWGACFMYCLILPIRLKGWRFAACAAAALFVQCAFLILTQYAPTPLWIFCMLLAFLLMFLFMKIMSGRHWHRVLYITFQAFILAEFAASLEWQLDFFFLSQKTGTIVFPQISSIVLMLLVYSAVFCAAAWIEKKLLRSGDRVDLSLLEIAAAGITALLTFVLSNLSFITSRTPFSAQIEPDIFTVRTLVDLAGLAILYTYQSRIGQLNSQRELLEVSSMLKSQYDSYRSYQDTIDIINLKYHDLKHALVGVRAEKDPEKRSAILDAMEEELESYKPEKQTGNYVLDAVIAGKSIRCRNAGISMTCVADGQLLDFMHVTDICSIFGNALDNAVENTALVTDPDKRLIHLLVTSRRDFVFIQVRNYCENELREQGGELLSTKKDSAGHGYGIRSIRYAVEKYGGTVTYRIKGRIFELNILIPLPR